MNYDPKKHQRRSIRLKGFDYSSQGMYYVTLRVKNGNCILGEVIDNQVSLSQIGRIVFECWQGIPNHVENVALDKHVIMPNHIHGILFIEKDTSPRKDVQLNVHTRKDTARGGKMSQDKRSMSEISPHKGSLSVIIRTFKAAVTTRCRRDGFSEFAWQSRFYEHVIRDGADLYPVR